MAYIFTIIFISKLVSVEMACLLGIQNEIQAVCKVILQRFPKHHHKVTIPIIVFGQHILAVWLWQVFGLGTKDIYGSFQRFQGKLVTYIFFPITETLAIMKNMQHIVLIAYLYHLAVYNDIRELPCCIHNITNIFNLMKVHTVGAYCILCTHTACTHYSGLPNKVNF